jgi:hypothetical protein
MPFFEEKIAQTLDLVRQNPDNGNFGCKYSWYYNVIRAGAAKRPIISFSKE